MVETVQRAEEGRLKERPDRGSQRPQGLPAEVQAASEPGLNTHKLGSSGLGASQGAVPL